MNKQTTPTIMMAVAVLAPSGVMFGANWFGQAPASVQAQPAPTPLPELQSYSALAMPRLDEPAPNPINLAAVNSPFWFEEVFENPAPDRPTGRGAPARADLIPSFSVSSILPNPKNPLAVINGKPCRVGDQLGDGWKLQSIDGDARTVTVIHVSGKRVKVSLKKNP